MIETKIRTPLKWLADDSSIPGEVAHEARAALDGLDGASWRPISVAMHGDLWLGNILFDRGPATPFTSFSVIDWGGADPEGLPVYDLVRVLDSFKPGRNRPAITQYLDALELTGREGMWHLLSAVGLYGLEPDQMDDAQVPQLVTYCHRTYSAAMPT